MAFEAGKVVRHRLMPGKFLVVREIDRRVGGPTEYFVRDRAGKLWEFYECELFPVETKKP